MLQDLLGPHYLAIYTNNGDFFQRGKLVDKHCIEVKKKQ